MVGSNVVSAGEHEAFKKWKAQNTVTGGIALDTDQFNDFQMYKNICKQMGHNGGVRVCKVGSVHATGTEAPVRFNIDSGAEHSVVTRKSQANNISKVPCPFCLGGPEGNAPTLVVERAVRS